MFEIAFYKLPSGKSPVEEFLDKLPGKKAQKVVWVLNIIEEFSMVLKYFKKLVNTDDLWEVRVSSGSNIFRLLCFFDGDAVVVVTHAFQKKTQKTPKQAIKTAEQRKKDYLRRKPHE